MSDTIRAYDLEAGALAARYELVAADAVRAALLEFIPRGQDLLALDVGAGAGCDAAWLASLDYQVDAAEPPAGMRLEAQRRHSDSWLSAVWMHVAPSARARAFRELATLLKPGGVMVMRL